MESRNISNPQKINLETGNHNCITQFVSHHKRDNSLQHHHLRLHQDRRRSSYDVGPASSLSSHSPHATVQNSTYWNSVPVANHQDSSASSGSPHTSRSCQSNAVYQSAAATTRVAHPTGVETATHYHGAATSAVAKQPAQCRASCPRCVRQASRAWTYSWHN